MNGNGCCNVCGEYAQVLEEQRDGTTIYRCYECGRIWCERLVVFDVSFALTEHKGEECQLVASDAISIPAPIAA